MRIFTSLSFFIFLVLTSPHLVRDVNAYTLTSTTEGQLIRWRYGQKLFLAGNPTGKDQLDPEAFKKTVIQGLQQWKWATEGQFDFEYWQGNDRNIYIPNLENNGLSSIFFASNSNETSDPNVIGFTQVWYNNNNGDLIETDIMLNDRNFSLTLNPADTSSQGSFGVRPKVALGNIVTHELGHALGLSHSGDINSSMLYVEFSEQARISCDDWAGAHHLYPSPSVTTGALTGVILSPQGDRVAGASVTAISKSRGNAIASVLSDQNGIYYFGALEPGSYSLMIQPFRGSKDSVPARVQSRTQNICSGGIYPSNFVTSPDSHSLKEFRVQAGGVLSAEAYSLGCLPTQDSQRLFSESLAPDLLVDVAPLGIGRTYSFESHGHFRISALAYLLMSPIHLTLKVTDAHGRTLQLQQKSPLYQSPDSSFIIPDSQVEGFAVGTIQVTASPQATDFSQFPSPALFPNDTPYFVLAFSDQAPALSLDQLPDNARCFPNTPFKTYTSPRGDPIRFSSTTSARDGIGFCAPAANAASNNQGKPSRSAPLEAIVGWFIPLGVIVAFQLYSKRRHAKLFLR
jgi:hypothetical protein